MARVPAPALLSEIRGATSAASQVKALRQLKNEIIGHEHKKRYWVQLGVLKHLVRVLNAGPGDGHGNLSNGTASSEGRARAHQGENDEAKLQAIIIIGSLAHGGPAFVPPLDASRVFPALFNLLSSDSSNPQIILQALRTVSNIAGSLCLATPEGSLDEGFINTLYAFDNLRNLARLLSEQDAFGADMPQVELIACTISKTCRHEHQRRLLDDSGVLEALTGLLRSWIASTFVPPAEEYHARWEPRLTVKDLSTKAQSRYASLLHALGTVVDRSEQRAQRLFSTCESIFQYMDRQFSVAWNNVTATLPTSLRAKLPGPPTSATSLLPIVAPQIKNLQSSANGYPPFDSTKTAERPSTNSTSTAIEVFSSHGLERVGYEESALLPWLIHMTRTANESISLASAWLLSILYQMRLVRNGRDADIALFVVPSLVEMLRKDVILSHRSPEPSLNSTVSSLQAQIKQDAPAILAKMAMNNQKITKAAVDAGAIKQLAQLLKHSYDSADADIASSMWSPEATEGQKATGEDVSTQIGSSGVSPAAWHIMRVRESTLVGLASISSTKDEYRKLVIEAGVTEFVIRALKGEDVRSTASPRADSQDPLTIDEKIAQGFCRESILAACGTARALGRSVYTLRTALMDAGLLPPIFALLKCQDMAIKIQATAVVSNLVMEFSPMRQACFEAGIIEVLCDHAHDPDTNLRLNSLWAIRHLLMNCPSDLKLLCIETLGMQWLKGIAASDPDSQSFSREREDGNITPMRMSTPNAAGEQVDLLNAVDEDSCESSQTPDEEGDEDTEMSDNTPSSLSKRQQSLLSRMRSRPLGGTGAGGPQPPITPNSTVIHLSIPDELAIVTQSLDIIRNFITTPDEDKMLDYVFREWGAEDFFRILASKIRPKVLSPLIKDRKSAETGTSSNAGAVRQIPPPLEPLKSALFTITHVAAGSTRHKLALMSHPKLLESLLPLLSHSDNEVRSTVCWISYNLTWSSDEEDAIDAHGRARKLAEGGWLEKLSDMTQGDSDLNCRERSKNAVQGLQQSLR